MTASTALVSDAGIAGVEQAPAPRPGGYAIDCRGRVHLRVLERMDPLDEIRARQTRLTSLTFVDADYRFGDSITALSKHGDVVHARFASDRQQAFDPVIGADGVHSAVRRLMFPDATTTDLGMSSSCRIRRGSTAPASSTANPAGRPVRDPTRAVAVLHFPADQGDFPADEATQRAAVTTRFGLPDHVNLGQYRPP